MPSRVIKKVSRIVEHGCRFNAAENKRMMNSTYARGFEPSIVERVVRVRNGWMPKYRSLFLTLYTIPISLALRS